MDILVVGSVALDSIETPLGKVDDILGGSAVYFSNSASFFTKVNLVGVVGEDFPKEHIEFLEKRNIDIEGLEKVNGKTFRWKGEYHGNMNEALTLDTQLNVFADFSPKIPDKYKKIPYLFLANIDPELQLKVLDQMEQTKLVICDTMNFWIDTKVDKLKEVLKKVDIILINDGEAKLLTNEENLFKAAKKILAMGPTTVVLKKGSNGAMLIQRDEYFSVPAYPLEKVYDPTGAGDTFAGGFVGSLAFNSETDQDSYGLKKAMIYGSTMASFNVEDFSLNRFKFITKDEIDYRYDEFIQFTHFEQTY